MGTWDTGPFDNDTAADWCDQLEEAEPAQRAQLVEAALTAVLHETGYLDSDLAAEAIAATAIVASQRPGGPPLESGYAPDFLMDGGTLPLPEHLAGSALRALYRIQSADSQWRQLWEQSDNLDEAVAALAALRAALTGPQAARPGAG